MPEIEPLHVHVDELTPVHVHVKKSRGNSIPSYTTNHIKSSAKTRRKSRSPRSTFRSQHPDGPWVPPPGKSTKGRQYWKEGCDNSVKELNRKCREIALSRKALEEQEDALRQYRSVVKRKDELNESLRKSCENLQKEADEVEADKDMIGVERDRLKYKLKEAELEGEAASVHLRCLRESLTNIKDESREDRRILFQHRDVLLEKLNDIEVTNASLRNLLRDHRNWESERESERDALITMKESLESTKAHLQNQLRMKEGECNRLSVQLRNSDSLVEQERLEAKHAKEVLKDFKEKSLIDKERFKKATRLQKDRADRNENALCQVNGYLLEKDAKIGDLTLTLDQMDGRVMKLSKDKDYLGGDRAELESKVSELNLANEGLSQRCHSYKLEIMDLKRKNGRLLDNGTDAIQLQDAVAQYEDLIADYKEQLLWNKEDAAALRSKVSLQEKQLNRSKQTFDFESDRADSVYTELEKTRKKAVSNLTETKFLNRRINQLEKKLIDADNEKGDVVSRLTNIEQKCFTLQAQLEDKSNENLSLVGKLEKLTYDNRSQLDLAREKSATRDQHLLQQLDGLENQLSRAKTELVKVRHSKDEADIRFNSRLQDLKDRLEQSHSTNRSMQNYVQFLKSSYANVFSDALARDPISVHM